ncbi:hypothetical protein BJX63DRAFT_415611 [Aspergillus granulosus]|uniref:Nucleolar protein Dnt1-like N-terminal domain-containing protein n=1 Tax=Aspergillus granulosus TaxID=176169 RepID=A0ABR4GUJ6_9EURO
MVFLRLTIKVYPRDQVPASNTFSLRSFLGDRDRDDSSRSASGSAAGKPASFLIVLEKPEEVTLGGLAGMIKDKWEKLRPLADPLAIKKLVDDEHESDDLDADMTVADVFVDNGKARSDGLDQRRVVRVIQKPANGDNSPVRFPSVSQDWDEAAEKYELQRKLKKEKLEAEQLETIAEESRLGSTSDYDSWSEYTPGRQHRKDIPVSSVEKDVEIPLSPAQHPRDSSAFDAALVSHNIESSNRRLASQELGDSPPSSRAPTPKKKIHIRRESTHSQNSAKQSGTGATPVADSPALQLARESFSHSVSPQKRPPPKEPLSDSNSLDDKTSSESESEASPESEQSEKSPIRPEQAEQDEDGDVSMADETMPENPRQPPSIEKGSAKPPSIPAETSLPVSQSRKRKNSAEQLSPNKEPRLDRTTPPPTKVNGERRNSQAPGTPKFSPGRSSFSGVARRLSFTEPATGSPKHGLGLGITRSPQKKPQVFVDLSQDSMKSNDTIPNSTPVPSSSAPSRRGSLAKNVSTPTNLHTPADKTKNLHSALRKDAPVERRSERRSVSFVDGDELSITGSQTAPTSVPKKATATPTESRKGTPSSQSTKSETRRISGGSMVFPPGFSKEQIEKWEREAAEKFEQQARERSEFEDKIKAAEEQNLNANYIRRLKSAYETWQTIQKLSKSNKYADKKLVERHRATLREQQAAIKKHEASMKPSIKGMKTKSSQKSPKSQEDAPEMPADEPAVTSKSTTPATANGEKTLPVAQTSWNAVNSKPAPTSPKPPAPKANGTPKSTIPRGFATQTATRTQPGRVAKSASSQSQNSGSDEVELPAMNVQARAHAAKKISPQNPIELSSDDEEEEADDDDDEEAGEKESESESSSEESSESESESESGSGKENANITSSSKPASQQPRSASPPSAQHPAKSPAVSQKTTSQPQEWSWPSVKPPNARPARASLKSLKGEVESQAAAKAAPKRAINGPPRRGAFSPDDSEETESESESEESSSSDDSDDSDKGSGDEGDIMSSGQVQRLRPARMR